MSILSLRPRQASMVWLEPHRVHAGGTQRALSGPLTGEALAPALANLPPGPTHWVVDDAWIPSLLIRDIVEIPAGMRDDFYGRLNEKTKGNAQTKQLKN